MVTDVHGRAMAVMNGVRRRGCLPHVTRNVNIIVRWYAAAVTNLARIIVMMAVMTSLRDLLMTSYTLKTIGRCRMSVNLCALPRLVSPVQVNRHFISRGHGRHLTRILGR